MILPQGTIKRIHVNQHHIKANAKDTENRPVFTVKNRGETFTGHCVHIDGEALMIYSPHKPLSCGAKVWAETTAEVSIS